MQCPRCFGWRTKVEVTRTRTPPDGPAEVVRLRRCLNSQCRKQFHTVEQMTTGLQLPSSGWVRSGKGGSADAGV